MKGSKLKPMFMLAFSIFLVCSIRAESPESLKPTQECVPGTTWKQDCNTCFCTDNGVAGCTYKLCHSSFVTIVPKPCIPNSTWTENCQSCLCSEEGVASCTGAPCFTPSAPQSV